MAAHVRLVLVTNSLCRARSLVRAMEEPFREPARGGRARRSFPFASVPALLPIYARGGVFISPRFLDNTYNWGHTEWKITLPMACGRVALGSPLPSYRDVAARFRRGGACDSARADEDWEAAFEAVLSGTNRF